MVAEYDYAVTPKEYMDFAKRVQDLEQTLKVLKAKVQVSANNSPVTWKVRIDPEQTDTLIGEARGELDLIRESVDKLLDRFS